MPLFPELIFSYFTIDAQSTKTLTQTFAYKGQTYTAGANVTSKYDLKQYEAMLGFPLFKAEAGEFSFLLGGKFFEIDSSIKDNGTGITESESLSGPLPVLGAKAEVMLPAKFKFGAVVRGLKLKISDVDTSLYDIGAVLHYDFNRLLRASVGYRYFLID